MFLGPGTQMVENDEFVYQAWITNHGDVPFPAQDMDVVVAWKFPDGHGHDETFHLKKDQLKPGDPPIQVWANIKVQAPGYAQFFITYPKADGCTLHDSERREIDGSGRYSLASF